MAQRTPVPEIDATEAMRMLSSRWEQRRSVREAFLSVDKDCDGVISPAELRASVDNMGVKLSGPEFRWVLALAQPTTQGFFLTQLSALRHSRLTLRPQEAVAHAGWRW